MKKDFSPRPPFTKSAAEVARDIVEFAKVYQLRIQPGKTPESWAEVVVKVRGCPCGKKDLILSVMTPVVEMPSTLFPLPLSPSRQGRENWHHMTKVAPIGISVPVMRP